MKYLSFMLFICFNAIIISSCQSLYNQTKPCSNESELIENGYIVKTNETYTFYMRKTNDVLRTTGFLVGTTSLTIRTEWLVGTIFPDKKIDAFYYASSYVEEVEEVDDNDSWWIVDKSIPVNTNKTEVVFELFFEDDLIGINQESITTVFFKLRISDLYGFFDREDEWNCIEETKSPK